MAEEVDIEIAYAKADVQILRRLRVSALATVGDALAMAARDAAFAQVDIGAASVGIFGRVVGRDHVLEPGDRLEIYAALCIDPKIARRSRARVR